MTRGLRRRHLLSASVLPLLAVVCRWARPLDAEAVLHGGLDVSDDGLSARSGEVVDGIQTPRS